MLVNCTSYHKLAKGKVKETERVLLIVGKFKIRLVFHTGFIRTSSMTHGDEYTVLMTLPHLQVRVSDPMVSHVPKSGHFLDYLNFEALFDFFLWSICWNLCNLALVKCLLKLSLPNLYKLNIFKWLNYGTKGVDHWVTYPTSLTSH